MVSHTFGFTPENSVVAVGLHAGRTGAYLRLDLPDEASSTSTGRTLGSYLAGPRTAPAPDALILLYFTDHAPAPAEDDPEAAELTGIHESIRGVLFNEFGLRIVAGWHLGQSHMRDIECSSARCCPYPGEDVSELATSMVNTALVVAGSQIFDSPRQILSQFLATKAPSDRMEAIADARSAGPVAEWQQALASWDYALGVTEEEGDAWWLYEDPEHMVSMLQALSQPALRDAVLVGAASWEPNGVLQAASASPDAVVEVCLGRTGGRPHWKRLDALMQICQALYPSGTGLEQAAICSLAGWTWWARGSGSVAGVYFDHCLAQHPDYQFAALLKQYLAVGGVCPWAQVREQSWSGHEGR